MRPPSIIWFERLYLGSLLISVPSAVLSYDDLLAEIALDLGPTSWAANLAGLLLFGTMAIGVLLWLWIAREGRNWAKWVLIAFLIFGLLVLPDLLGGEITVVGVLDLGSLVLECVAAGFLFRKDARAWLRKDRPIDVDVFH
jgi:hypothetical protein